MDQKLPMEIKNQWTETVRTSTTKSKSTSVGAKMIMMDGPLGVDVVKVTCRTLPCTRISSKNTRESHL
jgi:hypothetical protein